MSTKQAALEELRKAEDAFMLVLERTNQLINGDEELDEGWIENIQSFREQLEEDLDTEEFHAEEDE